ncbi:hypothetical protein A5874_001625, partial [Enterococcus faecium]
IYIPHIFFHLLKLPPYDVHPKS